MGDNLQNISERAFAFITDDEVFHLLTIQDVPELSKVIAGLQSRPLLIEITDRPEILQGGYWKYINGEFVKQNIQETEDPDDYEVE